MYIFSFGGGGGGGGFSLLWLGLNGGWLLEFLGFIRCHVVLEVVHLGLTENDVGVLDSW